MKLPFKVPAKGSLLREIPVLIVTAIVISVILKAFLIQAFYIPSGSMENTLRVNDRVIVNKLGMHLGTIGRGDIVVFKDPGGWLPEPYVSDEVSFGQHIKNGFVAVGLLPDPADQDLIKRTIGVAGDTVKCCDKQGRLSVNGVPIDEKYIYPGNTPSDLAFEVKVPKGSIWVMGDHRGASEDSRYHQEDPRKGMVPLDDVIGRAVAVIWPVGHAKTLQRPEVLTNIKP